MNENKEEIIENIDGDDSIVIDLMRYDKETKESKIEGILEGREEEINDKIVALSEIILSCDALVLDCANSKLANPNMSSEEYSKYRVSFASERIKSILLRSNEVANFDMDEFVIESCALFDYLVRETLVNIKESFKGKKIDEEAED